jgi:hypothetical protein
MDPAMQQFLEAQTQLLQNLTNTVTNQQAQVNNPPVQQPASRNKHMEFMSHHPLVFTHAADPLEAEDWLKTVLKMLTTCQCDDREKVMYAAGRLQGSASAWWDAFTAAHAAPDTITWDEFSTNFRSHHMPSGVMKIKKEFFSLKQGGMSVAEYRDKFTELSRYATKEVAEDRKKQELFLDGLAGSLRYQLMSYPFPNFQQLVDAAIRLEHKRKELGEQKRKATSSGHFGNASRLRFNPPQNTPFRFGGLGGNFGQQQSQRPAQQFQQSAQQIQRPVPQTPRSASQQSQQRAPAGTPVSSVAPLNSATTTCFKCGELDHYANACPKRNPPYTSVQNQ